MDKLNAITYFVTAAKAGTLTSAARSLNISLSTISQQIVALEKELKTPLFDRSRNGITLTEAGKRYLEACEPALVILAHADSAISSQDAPPAGSLRVGGHGHFLRCLAPWLPGFHEHFPDIQLDLRIMTSTKDLDDPAFDVMIVQGWPQKGDLIQKVLAQPRLLTCASPGFWTKFGLPVNPTDIENYNCLFFTNVEDTVNDVWGYERAGHKILVKPKGWLNSDTRGATVDAAINGHGVIRVTDLVASEHLHSGRLVPVLLDWHMLDAAPVSVLYSPTRKRNPRVRVFVEFVAEAFREMQMHTGYNLEGGPVSALPYWHRNRYRRASAAVAVAGNSST
jgi:DNA-binding transcriptional LysR family regulator